MTYYGALQAAMHDLAKREALFVGQSVRYKSNGVFNTLAGVPMAQRIEVPVFEDVQMGMCTGLAMAGYLPVCIFPRWDFALLAANQMVNHLDKHFRHAKVIIRVAVGARWPLHSGPQHTQDHTAAFRLMLESVAVVDLRCARDVVPAYRKAAESDRSTLLVEHADLYGEAG